MLNARVQAPPPDRPPHCRAVALSRDGGETWFEVTTRPDLPDPCCQGGLIRCEPGCTEQQPDCLLFTNLHSTGVMNPEPRRNLTVKLSYDAGRHWPVSRTLHAGPSAYSCPAVLPDGGIGVLYECGEAHRYEMLRFAKFPVEWLTDGSS
jgi:sialidase-1